VLLARAVLAPADQSGTLGGRVAMGADEHVSALGWCRSGVPVVGRSRALSIGVQRSPEPAAARSDQVRACRSRGPFLVRLFRFALTQLHHI
jgi:hypothetical protein